MPGRRDLNSAPVDSPIALKAPVAIILCVIAILVPVVGGIVAALLGLGSSGLPEVAFVAILTLVVAAYGLLVFKRVFKVSFILPLAVFVLLLAGSFAWNTQLLSGVSGLSLGLGPSSSSSCAATTPVCVANQTISMGGLLSFVFTQNIGNVIYNVQLACSTTANGMTGLPTPKTAFEWLGNGDMSGTPATGTQAPGMMQMGNAIQVTNLQCYTVKGSTPVNFTASATGAQFQGALWLNYTNSSIQVNKLANPWHDERIAVITVNAT